MITLRNGHKTFNLKDSWRELNTSEAAECVRLYKFLESGTIDFETFRINILKYLSGYRRPNAFIRVWRSLRGKVYHAENINSNLFLLSEMIRFPLRPVYDPEILEIFTEDLREELQTKFPWEIDDPQQVAQMQMAGESLKVQFTLNYDFGKNLVPEIVVGKQTLKGPLFTVDDYGELVTDLRVNEFIDADEYLKLYRKTNKPEHLNAFMAMLYRVDRGTYNTAINQVNATVFNNVSEPVKQTVIEVFTWIKRFFFNHPMYGMLFNTQESEKLTTGWDALVSGLSNEGEGSQNEINTWLITQFFNALFNQLKKQVAQMRAAEMDDGKISRKLNMIPEQVELL